MPHPTRSRETGFIVRATDKIEVTDTASIISVTIENSWGAEVHNAGEATVYIDAALATPTTDSYELAPGERAWLAGSISAICGAGESSVLKLLIVG